MMEANVVVQVQTRTLDLRKRLIDFMLALDGIKVIPPGLAHRLNNTAKMLTMVERNIEALNDELKRLQ